MKSLLSTTTLMTLEVIGTTNLLLLTTTNGLTLPPTTGPYVTGVHDSEFVDTTYPSTYTNDVDGRNIMFRVYYPICKKSNLVILTSNEGDDDDDVDTTTTTSTATCQDDDGTTTINVGRRREYMEPGEWEVIYGFVEPTMLTDSFDLTYSYLDASPELLVGNSHNFPIVLYMHGYTMYVNDNTALVEEIASQGYIVVAIASPGYASGIVYPKNGNIVTSKAEYPEIQATISSDRTKHQQYKQWNNNTQIRYNHQQLYLERAAMPQLIPRVRDDMLAMADYLDDLISSNQDQDQQEPTLVEPPPEIPITVSRTTDVGVGGSGGEEVDFILQQLFGYDPTGLQQRGGIIYMGYSLGGVAASSAAQFDTHRAKGAINLDGAHQSFDLFGTEIAVPYLTFSSNIDVRSHYYNEFFFEPLDKMGSRPDILRLRLSNTFHAEHSDFMDSKFLDPLLRKAILDLPEMDGETLHAFISEFCINFIKKYLPVPSPVGHGIDNDNDGTSTEWNVQDSIEKFSGLVEPIDVTYIATWAKEENSTWIGRHPANNNNNDNDNMANNDGQGMVDDEFSSSTGHTNWNSSQTTNDPIIIENEENSSSKDLDNPSIEIDNDQSSSTIIASSDGDSDSRIVEQKCFVLMFISILVSTILL